MTIIYYANLSGSISPIEQPDYYPVYQGYIPTPAEGQRVEQDKIVWQNGSWLMTYKLTDIPAYTAGEWLELMGIGAGQQPTLIYLKLQLMAALKTSDKLSAMEQYVSGMLAQYAADPSPRNDWQQPPYSYHETIAECVNLLQP